MHESQSSEFLIDRAKAGDASVLGDLLSIHHERLLRIVSLRLDRRMKGRLDASDVIQDAFMEATVRFGEFVSQDRMPFFLWLRFITMQKLCELHRRHLGAKIRDAGREISLYNGPYPEATSAVLAAQLLGRQTSPSQAAARAETKLRLEQALNEMEPMDREVLALRHFEQLTNTEASQVLGITDSAASNRYVRAVKRLKEVLKHDGG